jgi:formyl-CoA transferase
MIVEMDYPPRGTFLTVGCPMKLSDSPVEPMRPPMLGEHTEVLLGELCGVTAAEYRSLKDKGAV